MSLEVTLLAAFQAVVQRKEVRFDCSGVTKVPKNSRAYSCSVEACNRPAYAKALCNAHYIRTRTGKDLASPLERRLKGRSKCKTCEKQLDSHGGWGFCSRHYKVERNKALKLAAIETMGGRCSACYQVYPASVYDFHHVGIKAGNPGDILGNKNLATVAKELANCILLCANCHRIRHHGEIEI